jgi:CheY-like chemotaxis protein
VAPSSELTILRRPDGKPIRVLSVDDETMLAEMMAFALRYEKWEITTVGDGAAALVAARLTSPDVVVLDVMLPDMSGLTVLRELRRGLPNLPVLTGMLFTFNTTSKEKGIQVGFNAYPDIDYSDFATAGIPVTPILTPYVTASYDFRAPRELPDHRRRIDLLAFPRIRESAVRDGRRRKGQRRLPGPGFHRLCHRVCGDSGLVDVAVDLGRQVSGCTT